MLTDEEQTAVLEGAANWIENLISLTKRHGVSAAMECAEMLTVNEQQLTATRNNLRSRIYANTVFNRDSFIEALRAELNGQASDLHLTETKVEVNRVSNDRGRS